MNRFTVFQINLWPGFGGSEVYTRFTAEALSLLGYESILFVNSKASFWANLQLGSTRVITVTDQQDLAEKFAVLASNQSIVLTHSPLTAELAKVIAKKSALVGFVHQPMQYLNCEPYRNYQLLTAVSNHVLQSIGSLGFKNAYPKALFGISDIQRMEAHCTNQPIVAASAYEYDNRKFRDKLVMLASLLVDEIFPKRIYRKQSGFTLGIVSRLATIKGFPELLSILSPLIAKHRDVNLEIFGAGGFSYVKKMKKALRPISDRTRFWGAQNDVKQVYAGIDALLTGLPDREGLGLNVLEAQESGVPVIAPNAMPFSEVILDGRSGILYADPRLDRGRDFERRFDQMVEQFRVGSRLDPRLSAPEHLAHYRMESFALRLEDLLNFALKDYSNRTVSNKSII